MFQVTSSRNEFGGSASGPDYVEGELFGKL